MSTDAIVVQHAALDQASEDIALAARTIKARLQRLEGDLAPLSTRWSGQAQRSYQQARGQWDAAINDMVALLEQVSAAVEESNQAFRAADRRGAGRFT